MTTMISEIYDALKDAQGVSDEKARKAAEAAAQFDTRFSELKFSFEGLRNDFEKLKVEFEKLKGEVLTLKWMAGVNIALTFVMLGSGFAIWSKLGELTAQISQIAHAAH